VAQELRAYVLKLQTSMELGRPCSAVIGALASVVNAVLVQYALLDIAFESWAAWYYAVLFLLIAIFVYIGGDKVMPPRYTQIYVIFFVISSLLCLCLGYSLGAGFVLRLLAFSFLGTTLSYTLVASIMVLFSVWSTFISPDVEQRVQPVSESQIAAKRLLWLTVIGLVEGAFFGSVIALLETSNRPHVFHMPHADMGMTLPLTCIIGALAGWCLQDAGYVKADGIESSALEMVGDRVDQLSGACTNVSTELDPLVISTEDPRGDYDEVKLSEKPLD